MLLREDKINFPSSLPEVGSAGVLKGRDDLVDSAAPGLTQQQLSIAGGLQCGM